jgi:hypothetical protein
MSAVSEFHARQARAMAKAQARYRAVRTRPLSAFTSGEFIAPANYSKLSMPKLPKVSRRRVKFGVGK